MRPSPGEAVRPHPVLPVPQVLVIDGRGHLLGRLAAIVAKQVLLGECGKTPGIHRENTGNPPG